MTLGGVGKQFLTHPLEFAQFALKLTIYASGLMVFEVPSGELGWAPEGALGGEGGYHPSGEHALPD